MAAAKQKPKVKPKPKAKKKQSPQLSSKELDLGLKPANEITEKDDLVFELGRLRTLFEMWDYDLQYNGVVYHLLVDPLNRNVSMVAQQ